MGISLGTLFGMLAGVGLLLYNIVAKAPDLAIFIDVGSLLMVVGGTHIQHNEIEKRFRSVISDFRKET